MDQPILQAKSEPVKSASANPANAPEKRVTERNRIPMNLPQLKLGVPEIPGFYLYWHLGQNIPRALKAGYEFVDAEEVELANSGLADDANKQGNSDLGSRVSTIAGGLIEGTPEPQRLYLMKIRNEWHEADAKGLEAVNERIASAIRGGRSAPGQDAPGETHQDKLQRYLKKGQDLFIPKRR